MILLVLLLITTDGPSLCADCPKYFRKRDGLCYLDTPYQAYEEGLYGLRKVPVPSKDGLDPRVIDISTNARRARPCPVRITCLAM